MGSNRIIQAATFARQIAFRAGFAIAVAAAAAGTANAGDATKQGTFSKGGQNCQIISTMVIGSDGKPHSTVTTVCK